MKTLFQEQHVNDIISRINKLQPSTEGLWGKMKVDQMLVHSSYGLQSALGDVTVKRPLFAKIIGPLFKSSMLSEKPFPKNSPTGTEFVVTGKYDFAAEKERLLTLVNRFAKGGPSVVTKNPHGFIGKITPDEWARMMYKHLDHHLAQFGV